MLRPVDSRLKSFRYVGADSSTAGIPLQVDYVDRDSGAAFRMFLIALLVLVGWFLRTADLKTKLSVVTLGFAIPLALIPLVPVSWQVLLDGLLFGALAATGVWFACGCATTCARRSELRRFGKISQATAAIIFAFALPGSCLAEENPPSEKSANEPRPTTLIVPYDVAREPTASDRVFLPHERFLELMRLAEPDRSWNSPQSPKSGIVEALYAAKLIPNPQSPDRSVVEVKARYAIRNFVDGQSIVDLPVGVVSAREAKLDGQTAALIAGAAGFQVAIPAAGSHVLDFTFEIPAQLSGTTGSFTVPFLPVPAGKFVIGLPAKDLLIRVNGSSTVFRRVTQADAQSLELPIDKGGDLTIAWQPEQARGTASAVIQVDSTQAITLSDAGCAVNQAFAYRVRQGGVSDISFQLPDALRLQTVNGPDVGGWEVQGEGASRKLRVLFRRNITDQTRVTIDTFLGVKVESTPTVIPIPSVTPQEISNEIGQVAVYAGDQFTVRGQQVESLAQIDTDKFSTSLPAGRPSAAPRLAYRFSKRPFALSLQVTRLEHQAQVTADQAAFISLRKQQITTRMRYQLTGAARRRSGSACRRILFCWTLKRPGCVIGTSRSKTTARVRLSN